MRTHGVIRKSFLGLAALTTTVFIGGAIAPPAQAADSVTVLLTEGPGPSCPTGGGAITSSKLYPATGGTYRGVVFCAGQYQGENFRLQVLRLDDGASLRVVSHPTNGTSVGGSNTQFDKLTASQWRTNMSSYNQLPGTSDLFSTVNAGFFKSTANSTTALSFPERKAQGTMSLGFGYGNLNDPDYNAEKQVLKIGAPPGSTQAVKVEYFGNRYNGTDVLMPNGPAGTGSTYDGVVGFSAFNGPEDDAQRTWVGTSADHRTVFIVTTLDNVTRSQMFQLFAALGISSEHAIQLDGGPSTQLSTRVGNGIDGGWPVPEVLAVYEGIPPTPDNGMAVGDLNADGWGDVIGRKTNGELWRYMNSANLGNPFPGSAFVGPTWNQFKWWLSDDVNGDGYDDIVAARYDWTLWLYTNTHNSSAPLNPGIQIGTNWGIYSNVTIGAVNPGDTRADIIAKKPDGSLWRYINTGSSTQPYTTPTQIDSGWQTKNRIKLGDINHDGKDDIVATSPDGKLWSLVNTMTGTTGSFSTTVPREIGSGWQDIDRFVVADVTGDGLDDIMATRPNGTLWRYQNVWPIIGGEPFQNPFIAPVQVGSGWQPFN